MGLAPKTRYDGVAMIIHWLTAILMIYMVFFGEDLMKAGMKLAKAGDTANATFQPFLVYSCVALLYFALCYPVSYFAKHLERKVQRGHA